MGATLAVLVTVGLLAGCGDDDGGAGADGAGEPARDPITIAVPADHPTISEAIDAAQEGDTILVSPGSYAEEVHVDVPGLTLQGTDRNGVVVEGNGTTDASGITVVAPGVTIANLTVQNFVQNGVLVTGFTENGGMGRGSDGYQTLDPEEFPPLQGFAVRYVTASNNGLYGIYAFDAQNGVIEDNYASGHPDSGIYVGQCEQCDIVVRGNVAERNAVGYEQANASDSVVVVGNRFVGNRVGLTVLSDYQEAFVPNRSTTVVGNLVADNNQVDTPQQAEGGFGIGIGLSGTVDSTVERNRVEGNESAGMVLSSSQDVAPTGNRLLDNAVARNGVDVWFAASEIAPGEGNCLTPVQGLTTRPADLSGFACPDGGSGVGVPLTGFRNPEGIPFFEVVAPPEQPTMPEADFSLGAGSVDVDLDAVRVPPADLLADRSGL